MDLWHFTNFCLQTKVADMQEKNHNTYIKSVTFEACGDAKLAACRAVSLAKSYILSASLFVQLLPITSDTVNRLLTLSDTSGISTPTHDNNSDEVARTDRHTPPHIAAGTCSTAVLVQLSCHMF